MAFDGGDDDSDRFRWWSVVVVFFWLLIAVGLWLLIAVGFFLG